jgi:TRAP-type C4-dicarboxylate transport system permease small subunit
MDVLEPASLPRRVRRGLLAAEKIAATLLLVAVTGLVVLQVVARYVFDRPLFWTDELARYCYVWLSFVAAVAVTAGRSDVVIDVVDRIVGPRTLVGIKAVAHLVVVATCAWMVYGSFDWLLQTAKLKSPALGMPMIWLYAVVSLTFALMALHAAANLAFLLSGREEPADDAMAE